MRALGYQRKYLTSLFTLSAVKRLSIACVAQDSPRIRGVEETTASNPR